MPTKAQMKGLERCGLSAHSTLRRSLRSPSQPYIQHRIKVVVGRTVAEALNTLLPTKSDFSGEICFVCKPNISISHVLHPLVCLSGIGEGRGEPTLADIDEDWASRPRSFANKANILAARQRLQDPHVKPLTEWVAKLRKYLGNTQGAAMIPGVVVLVCALPLLEWYPSFNFLLFRSFRF